MVEEVEGSWSQNLSVMNKENYSLYGMEEQKGGTEWNSGVDEMKDDEREKNRG